MLISCLLSTQEISDIYSYVAITMFILPDCQLSKLSRTAHTNQLIIAHWWHMIL